MRLFLVHLTKLQGLTRCLFSPAHQQAESRLWEISAGMHEILTSLLQASFQGFASLTVCGGDAAAYAATLEKLLALLPGQHSIVLLDQEVPFTAPHDGVFVHRDSEMSGDLFARAASRQDPDSVVLDLRAGQAADILLSIKTTGHRVITHVDLSAAEAHAAARACIAAQLPGLEAELLARDLYLQLDQVGQPKALWQAGLEGQLLRLARRDGEDWREENPLLGLQATRTIPVEEPALEVPADWLPRSRSFLEEVRQSLSSHRREAWGPVPGTQGSAGRYGGIPRLSPGENWPRCGDCHARLQLVLEIALAQAPAALQRELGEEGLFQLFYCIAPSCSAPQPWQPFSANSLVRVLQGETVEPGPEDRLLDTPYDEIPLAGWTPFWEGPAWEERQALQPETAAWELGCLDAVVKLALYPEAFDSHWRLYEKLFAYFEIAPEQIAELSSYLGTATGDKLLGWPWWSQAPSYPPCPECSEPMRMVVQINNDGGGPGRPGYGSMLGQVFAADGNGHVFSCHGHLAFAWACG